MTQLEKALANIANGYEWVRINNENPHLESVHCLIAACSAESSKVTQLSLRSCGLNAVAVELIASSLRSKSVLTWLDLAGNEDIGPRGAQALGEMLCVSWTLKVVELYECNLGDKGAVHLAVALRQNRTLEVLLLFMNDISHVGAAALAAALPFNQTLKDLQLNHNPLGDDGVEALAKAVALSGLRKLCLHRTYFGGRGCAALVEMLKNGSQLRNLQTDSDHWPALEEGFRCNGWLLMDATEQYRERNKAMHLRARKSVYTLLLIRKLRRTALSSFPKEVVHEIAQFVFSSQGEVSVWDANEQQENERNLFSLCSPPSPCLSPFDSFLHQEKYWWSWRPLVRLLILFMAKINSLRSQQLLLSWSRQYSPNTRSQQESTAPARDGPRKERHQSDSTQAWLLDCHPHH
jgi:hypothetical protein